MKLITRDIDYAVRALIFIGNNNKDNSDSTAVSISEIVEKLDVPKPFMRKILQVLSSNGILTSHKGNKGGFNLALKPEEVFLYDIVEIFQGKFSLNDCLFKKNICPDRSRCLLKKKIDSIQEQVEDELKKISLKSLMEGE